VLQILAKLDAVGDSSLLESIDISLPNTDAVPMTSAEVIIVTAETANGCIGRGTRMNTNAAE